MDNSLSFLLGLAGGVTIMALFKFNNKNDSLKTNFIIKKLDLIMAKSQERFDLLMGRLDTITTNIAEDYKTLLAAVQEGTISEESFTKHEANIAKLEELGASVENPVPEPTPEA